MLINFSVENFRSFGTEQTINMVATGLKDHSGHCVSIPHTDKRVLQAGVIYGANASGKSNLVKAIQYAQRLVLGKASTTRHAQQRFLFTAKPTPSSFEFRFLSQGQVFVYGFSITRDAIVEEWLYATSETGREVAVFKRKASAILIGRLRPFGKKEGMALRKTLTALRTVGVRNDQLLLSKIAEIPLRGELLDRVVWWFAECLIVVEPDSHFPALLDLLDDEKSFSRFCGAFLKNVGTGIDGLRVEQETLEADRVPKKLLEALQAPDAKDLTIAVGSAGLVYELAKDDPNKILRKNLEATHSVGDAEFSIAFQEESDGTQRCLNLLPALYHLTKAARVFVVDEIDRSLHPLLCHALLKLYLDACPGGCRQMIVTTHETHLLDLELLRRDEIWFMEKDKLQQSHLSSLGEWNTRKDLRIERGYLHGRFGGIPFIGDTKKLLDMIHCPVSEPSRDHEKEAPTRPEVQARA